MGGFLSSPVVRTPHFHCREHGFSLWLGKFLLAEWHGKKKKKKKKIFIFLLHSSTSQFRLARFQAFSGYMGLVATLLISPALYNFYLALVIA